jgi:hypothetical protein
MWVIEYVDELTKEIGVLRQYGNKECTDEDAAGR